VPTLNSRSLALFLFTALWLSGCTTDIKKTTITDRNIEKPVPAKKLNKTEILEASINRDILISGDYSEKPIKYYQQMADMSEPAVAQIKRNLRTITFELPPQKLTLEGKSKDGNHYKYPTRHPLVFRADKTGEAAYGGLILSTDNPDQATHIYWNWMGKKSVNGEYFIAPLSKPIRLDLDKRIRDSRFTAGNDTVRLLYSGVSNGEIKFTMENFPRHKSGPIEYTTTYRPGIELVIQKSHFIVVEATSTGIKYKVIHPLE
jgi:hypothetical protein